MMKSQSVVIVGRVMSCSETRRWLRWRGWRGGGCWLLLVLTVQCGAGAAFDFTNTDDLENHISPDDLATIERAGDALRAGAARAATAAPDEDSWSASKYWDADEYDDIIPEEDRLVKVTKFTKKSNDTHTNEILYSGMTHHFWKAAKKFLHRGKRVKNKDLPKAVSCFGSGVLTSVANSVFNMRPAARAAINTHFYFSSRKQRHRAQVWTDEQFGLEWTDFDPARRSVLIVHGFMSHSNASWVRDMTQAFLDWEDVNVITVDWSGGGRTWKYWRAVANTRRVGDDVTLLLQRLTNATGCRMSDFHLVGHSLGAHICSYAATRVGGVRRITGLDPAQPCFSTQDRAVLLDSSDADFVDVIHTNGRLMKRLGLGMPNPVGDADFYPNGGMKQPGCYQKRGILYKIWPLPVSPTKFRQAICSHGRAHHLFTESLTNKNCSFRAHRWDMTLEGVNASLDSVCDLQGSCAEMGIRAEGVPGGLPRAKGQYFVLTAASKPFCDAESERRHASPLLLRDLAKGFKLDHYATTEPSPFVDYGSTAIPVPLAPVVFVPPTAVYEEYYTAIPDSTTTKKPFWKFWK